MRIIHDPQKAGVFFFIIKASTNKRFMHKYIQMFLESPMPNILFFEYRSQTCFKKQILSHVFVVQYQSQTKRVADGVVSVPSRRSSCSDDRPSSRSEDDVVIFTTTCFDDTTTFFDDDVIFGKCVVILRR